MIYLVLLTVLIILTFVDYTNVGKYNLQYSIKINKYKAYIFYFIIFIFIIFVGFRYYTGFDYKSYVNIYNNLDNGFAITSVEIGYKLLNIALSKIVYGPWLVFLVMAMLTLSLNAYVIKKESKKIFFSLFIWFCLYFLVGAMGQIRSTFAQSIDFLAIYLYLKNEKKYTIISFLLIVLSSAFHVSSICMLLMFLVKDRKFSIKTYIILYIVVAILGQFLDLNFIGHIGKEYGGFIGNKIYAYTTNPEFAHKIGISSNVIFDFGVFIFAILMKKKYKLNSRRFNLLFNLYFISNLSFLIFNNYFVLAVRFSNYFRVALPLLIPLLISEVKNKKIRLIIIILFVLFMSLMVVRMLMVNMSVYIPYKMNIGGVTFGG